MQYATVLNVFWDTIGFKIEGRYLIDLSNVIFYLNVNLFVCRERNRREKNLNLLLQST